MTKIKASQPRCSLTKSSHLVTKLKVSSFVRSKTMKAAWQSLRQLGIRLLNLYCPAVSHSCRRIGLPSMLTFLETKSIPIVDYILHDQYIMRCIECIFDESSDDGGFPNVLFSYEDYLLFFDVAFVGGIANFLLLSVHYVPVYIFKQYKHFMKNNTKQFIQINALSTTKKIQQSDFRVHFTLMNVKCTSLSHQQLVDSIANKINQYCAVNIIQIANIIDDEYVDVSVGLFNDAQAFQFLKNRKQLKFIDEHGEQKTIQMIVSRGFKSYLNKYLPSKYEQPQFKIQIKIQHPVKEEALPEPQLQAKEQSTKLCDKLWLFGIPSQFTAEDVVKVFQSRQIHILDSRWVTEDGMQFLEVVLEKLLTQEHVQKLALRVESYPFVTIPALSNSQLIMSYLMRYEVEFTLGDRVNEQTIIGYVDGIGGVNILLRNEYKDEPYFTIVFNSVKSAEKMKKSLGGDFKHCLLVQQMKFPIKIHRLKKYYTFESVFLQISK